jgi:hypothetical protein
LRWIFTIAAVALTGCHAAAYHVDGRPLAQVSLLWSVKEEKPDSASIAAVAGGTSSWLTGSMWPAVAGTIPRDFGALVRSPATAVENLTTTTQQANQKAGSGQLPGKLTEEQ